MALRVVRAAVLTSLLAVVFLLLVVVGSAIADDDAALSSAEPHARAVPTRVALVADTTAVVAQSDTARAPRPGTGAVVQKSGPAAAATARTIDIVVVSALVFLGLWVWVRVGSTRKGH